MKKIKRKKTMSTMAVMSTRSATLSFFTLPTLSRIARYSFSITAAFSVDPFDRGGRRQHRAELVELQVLLRFDQHGLLSLAGALLDQRLDLGRDLGRVVNHLARAGLAQVDLGRLAGPCR